MEQALDTIRNNACFTEMTRALQINPEKYATRVTGFISSLSPALAEAMERYGYCIVRQMYEDVQVEDQGIGLRVRG